jgi:hypothetical protein
MEANYLTLFGLRKTNAVLLKDVPYTTQELDEYTTDAEAHLLASLGRGVSYTLRAGQPLWVHEDTAFLFLPGHEMPSDAFPLDLSEYQFIR